MHRKLILRMGENISKLQKAVFCDGSYKAFGPVLIEQASTTNQGELVAGNHLVLAESCTSVIR